MDADNLTFQEAQEEAESIRQLLSDPTGNFLSPQEVARLRKYLQDIYRKYPDLKK